MILLYHLSGPEPANQKAFPACGLLTDSVTGMLLVVAIGRSKSGGNSVDILNLKGIPDILN